MANGRKWTRWASGISRNPSPFSGNLNRQLEPCCGMMNRKQYMASNVEISIPDSLVKAMGAEPEELPRQTLEALIVQAYRKGQITHAQVGDLLVLDRWNTDAFLKNAQAFRATESEEFASDLESLRRISK